MNRYLKKGATEEQVAEADRKVRETVEAIIDEVGHRGDNAVRELSVSLDRWEPASFRLDGLKRRIDREPAGAVVEASTAQAQVGARGNRAREHS